MDPGGSYRRKRKWRVGVETGMAQIATFGIRVEVGAGGVGDRGAKEGS